MINSSRSRSDRKSRPVLFGRCAPPADTARKSAMETENNENRGFTYIPYWMCELGLRSSELITYAVIYGYTMRCGSYTGSLAFLAKRACLTKQGLIKVLARLTELGHITRRKIGEEKKFGSAKYAYFALVNGSPPRRRASGRPQAV